MTTSIQRVREFHTTFGHPVADKPTPSTKEIRELRVKLIAEELIELCEASGVSLELTYHSGVPAQFGKTNHRLKVKAVAEDVDVDMVETADALGDLDYVVQGANLVFGIPGDDVSREIHRSNMSKLSEDGKPIVREDGKIMKGPNYSPPNIEAILNFDDIGG